MSMTERPRNLFLALTIPDDMFTDDPDDVADAIAHMLNEHRQNSAWAKAMLDGTYDIESGDPRVERIMVNAIPTPQWLSRETLDNLRRAAKGDPA